MIQVHTMGPAKEVKDVSNDELFGDEDHLKLVIESINQSEEVRYAYACLQMAAYKHMKNYPGTSCHISPALNLIQFEEVTDGDG